MRKFLFLALVLALVLGTVGCGQQATGPLAAPKVELKRVELASNFDVPWAGWPATPPTPTPFALPAGTTIRVPLILGFIFDVSNSNDATVTLDQIKFTVEFEAAPNEYFALNTPIAYERMSIPAKTTNQYRVTVIMDSAVVPGNLAVTSGARMSALKLSGTGLVQKWWTEIGDFKYGIKATGGTADFSSASGKLMATFEGKFPK